MRGTTTILILCGLCAAEARGQESTARSLLERVDPGIGDVGPLSTSQRQLPMDLRTPTGFENVYRVRGREDTLLRISGGLAATFPKSQYVPTAWGQVPVVPPGTVFHIGGVPKSLFGEDDGAGETRAYNAIDRTAIPRAPGSYIPPPLPPRPEPPSLWESELYRSYRLRTLLLEASASAM